MPTETSAPVAAPGASAPALTRDEIDRMDADGLRVAVADVLGWGVYEVFAPPQDDRSSFRYEKLIGPEIAEEWTARGYTIGKRLSDISVDPSRGYGRQAPDWPGDIAAAYQLGEEAEKRGKAREYGVALQRRLADSGRRDSYRLTFVVAHASPADRCRAFLFAIYGEGQRNAAN